MILPRKPAAVVFDMDGLLFDSESLYQEAVVLAAVESGYEAVPDLFHRMVGLPVIQGHCCCPILAMIFRSIPYKAESAGVDVRLVDPRRSSQTCPDCGTITPKTLAQREHRCDCGCVLDRDVAAARIVLHRAGFRPGTGPQAQPVRDAA